MQITVEEETRDRHVQQKSVCPQTASVVATAFTSQLDILHTVVQVDNAHATLVQVDIRMSFS